MSETNLSCFRYSVLFYCFCNFVDDDDGEENISFILQCQAWEATVGNTN